MQKKIIFPLQQHGGFPPVSYEGIWGTEIDSNLYVVDNIPFFVNAATLGDKVSVEKKGEELFFKSVIERSNNSLIRVVVYSGTNSKDLNKDLERLGCETEFDTNHSMMAISVPTGVDVVPIQRYLHVGHCKDMWDYEEPILRHKHYLET